MKGALAECLALVRPADPRELERTASGITSVDESIGRAQQQLKSLFGFEAAAKPRIVAGIDALKRERSRLINLSKYGEYGSLSLAPLKWRDKEGRPKLVVLSLGSPRFQLSCEGKEGWEYHWNGDRKRRRYTTKVSPKLPKLIADCYADVLKSLTVKAKERKKSIHLRTEFEGVIPSSMRAKIVEAQKDFDEVFLIAEAKNWQLVETRIKAAPRPNRGDPIIVGFDGANLWVVDSFDLTSLERMVKSNFTL